MPNDFESTLAIFSATLTPVILISTCGTLTLSTSNRLSRAVDRARKIAEMVEALTQSEATDVLYAERRALIFGLLNSSTERARLLHRALACLYFSLSIFVATSVALGFIAFSNSRHTEVPILLGVIGVALLFYASILLILETQIARSAINDEMNFVRRVGEQFAPPELKEQQKRRGWRFFLPKG